MSLRPAVYAFEADLLHAQQRAARAGTRPRSDHTIETALGTVRDLAIFLAGRGRTDWAVVDVHDIEAFLAAQPNTRPRRLTVLRQFFRTAQAHKIILVAPTRTLKAKRHKGFTGATLRLDQQRALYRRWTSTTPHPHEALLGLLALLHGASCQEVRLARCQDIDSATRSLRLGRRPVPTRLDPATWQVLQRALAHRGAQGTDNPHLLVTKGTKAGSQPASTAYLTHLLDPVGNPRPHRALHSPGRPGQHRRPQDRRRRVRHERRRRHGLPQRPRRPRPTPPDSRRTRQTLTPERIPSREQVRFAERLVGGDDQ